MYQLGYELLNSVPQARWGASSDCFFGEHCNSLKSNEYNMYFKKACIIILGTV